VNKISGEANDVSKRIQFRDQQMNRGHSTPPSPQRANELDGPLQQDVVLCQGWHENRWLSREDAYRFTSSELYSTVH